MAQTIKQIVDHWGSPHRKPYMEIHVYSNSRRQSSVWLRVFPLNAKDYMYEVRKNKEVILETKDLMEALTKYLEI